MDNTDKNNLKKAQKNRDMSSLLIYGTDSTLKDEENALRGIIQKTIIDTKAKFGERTNGKPLNYFNEINFGKAFNTIFDTKDSKDKNIDIAAEKSIKKIMENGNINLGAILLENEPINILYNNYRLINKHIPECSNALKVYKDNIMSPDDFTKLIFNVNYNKVIDQETKDIIESNLKKITDKYQIENKAEDIIEEALMLGKSYYAILSLDNEMETMLDDPIYSGNVLNEETFTSLARLSDENYVNVDLDKASVEITNTEKETLSECLNLGEGVDTDLYIMNMINENVQIGSKKEFLRERFNAEKESLNDIPSLDTRKKETKKKKDKKPLYLNGSVLRHLDPEKVIPLKVDDICYGYYYVEDYNAADLHRLGPDSGRNIGGVSNFAANGTLSGNSVQYNPASAISSQFNISDQKMSIIADVFLRNISNKINKKFIRDNKEFKDFIYSLLRQNYILKKGLKLTYFKPDSIR